MNRHDVSCSAMQPMPTCHIMTIVHLQKRLYPFGKYLIKKCDLDWCCLPSSAVAAAAAVQHHSFALGAAQHNHAYSRTPDTGLYANVSLNGIWNLLCENCDAFRWRIQVQDGRPRCRCRIPVCWLFVFCCVICARVYFATTAVTATYGNNIRDKSFAAFFFSSHSRPCCFTCTGMHRCKLQHF